MLLVRQYHREQGHDFAEKRVLPPRFWVRSYRLQELRVLPAPASLAHPYRDDAAWVDQGRPPTGPEAQPVGSVQGQELYRPGSRQRLNGTNPYRSLDRLCGQEAKQTPCVQRKNQPLAQCAPEWQ